jgi:DNA-binding response OmpR family regulator
MSTQQRQATLDQGLLDVMRAALTHLATLTAPHAESPVRRVAARQALRVLVLTTFDQDEHVCRALSAGASGFLLKDATAEEFRGRGTGCRGRGVTAGFGREDTADPGLPGEHDIAGGGVRPARAVRGGASTH